MNFHFNLKLLEKSTELPIVFFVREPKMPSLRKVTELYSTLHPLFHWIIFLLISLLISFVEEGKVSKTCKKYFQKGKSKFGNFLYMYFKKFKKVQNFSHQNLHPANPLTSQGKTLTL